MLQSDLDSRCPHCGELRGKLRGEGDLTYYDGSFHICADSRPWTQEERDIWRQEARRRKPNIIFAPSKERFAELFGGR